jgi:O-antigen/teichoic acid export membrane protein
MSTIRKQSIISSVIVYFGFALGFLNTYLFTRQGGLTKEEFGLTNTFIAIANIMFSIAGLGMPAYISKFFPYYKAHVDDKNNDQLTWALLLPCLGFLVVVIACIIFKGPLIDHIFSNSPQLPRYFYWIFPFGFGYTIFMVLEAYAWQQRKAVLSNFLKEVLIRILVTILIVLATLQVIKSFDVFIKLYAFTYLIVTGVLLYFFYKNHQLHFTVTKSNVTRKFYSKIKALVSFVWGGSLVFNVASVFNIIVIAAVLPNGMAIAGIFTLAQNLSSLIQAPQRAIISASVGPLSQAWKEKDYGKINKVYHRSSINQLIFSCAMFCLIWLSFEDGIHTFHLQNDYIQAKWVFFYIGLTRIIDMGTGLNAQIIGTSTYWRFEFISGLILFAITLPLNYVLTRKLGITGPAISDLIAFTIYNLIRYLFLWNKFRMQPFTTNTIYTLILAFACYLVSYWLFNQYQGLIWIIVRSAVFSGLFAAGMFGLKLSPDAGAVLLTVKRRLGLSRYSN